MSFSASKLWKFSRLINRFPKLPYNVKNNFSISGERVLKEKKLFTPGPLCVSPSVRAALTMDLGSRDSDFIGIVKHVRDQLVKVAELSAEKYTTILMQGSGTFSVESVLQSTSDRSKKALILASGAYGRRMGEICSKASIPHTMLEFPENEPVKLDTLWKVLESSKESWGSVSVVHCETTSGVLNPITDIGKFIKRVCPNTLYIVDAMSSFGGVVADFRDVDFLISSANKCLQGVPGFAFVVANIERLHQCKGRSMSVSLDLYEQWKGLENLGQFRFTPPTHAILGLNQALKELQLEGGVPARAKRYSENNRIVKSGLKALGFEQFVLDEHDGHIITSFKYPTHPNFKFQEFYDRLSDKGQLIYPGKVTNANCFRIGNIGHLFPQDFEHLLNCISQVLQDMSVPTPVVSCS